MIKILAIGNSFSEDAMEHLHLMAKTGGIDMLLGNLYIGGCSLETHWRNASEDASAYDFYKTGEIVKRSSIREALKEEEWDYVTLQQASHDSGKMETYYPFINYLSDYVKRYAPQAEQMIHQTWAYEIDSTHGCFKNYNNNQSIMFEALKTAYSDASRRLKLRIIPCGEAVQLARTNELFNYRKGGKSLCRDGFHASLTLGRYLLSSVWYEVITGKSILDNTFIPKVKDFDDPDANELEILRHCAHDAVKLYR
jgi:hypothetical protein